MSQTANLFDPALLPQWKCDITPNIRGYSPLFEGRTNEVVVDNIRVEMMTIEFELTARDYSFKAKIGVFHTHVPRVQGESPVYFIVRSMDIDPDRCKTEHLHKIGRQVEEMYWKIQPSAEVVQKALSSAFVNHNRAYYA